MKLLTVQESAGRLRVHPMTVRCYIASGRLAGVRVGRGIRVPEEAIERFVTAVEPTTAEQTARAHDGKPFTLDDPLWNIVGIGGAAPGGATDVSEDKYSYLADAYDSTRR